MRFQTAALLAALILTAGLATACNQNQSGSHEDGVHNSVKVDADMKAAKSGEVPELNASLTLEGSTAVISFVVANMTLSPEHHGKKHAAGEGHLHVTVDGVQKDNVKHQVPIRIKNLSPGKHTIKLEVQKNDHAPYNVQKVFEFEVKKS